MRGVDGLKAAGCGAIAIPCNTAHGWFEPMAERAGIPILHIVDAAADELRRIGVSRGTIGLMGTASTLAMKLYQNRLASGGWDIIEPEPTQMERLVMPSIAAVKANRVAETFEPLAEVVNSLASRGASAVILGCTEIPLGIQAGPSDLLRVPVIDTIDALARASIKWARPGFTG
jgi:aspartate racemase